MREGERERGRERTHMEPLSAALDHALAFRGKLAKVRCEDRRRDDRTRHVMKSENDVVYGACKFPDIIINTTKKIYHVPLPCIVSSSFLLPSFLLPPPPIPTSSTASV